MLPSIALPYKQMNVSQKVHFAKNLIQKITRNQKFNSLLPNVLELSTNLEEWQIAIKNAQCGGKISTILKIEKGLTVSNKVFALATKVENLAKRNEQIIESAGFKNQRIFNLEQNAFTREEVEEVLVTLV